jgi:hypothetical protein
MKRNTKIAIAAGGGLLGLVALYLYYTSQGQGEGGGGGGGVSGGGGGSPSAPSPTVIYGGPGGGGLSLDDLLALLKKGGAGYGAPGTGPGGGATVVGGGVAIPVPSTLSTLSKFGMALQLQGNPQYAPGYLQEVAANNWQATSLSSPGSPGAGVIMAVSPEVVASAGLKKNLLFTNAAGDIGAKVTGVTSQGIVQTTAGSFYAPSPTNPSLAKKAGTAFVCRQKQSNGSFKEYPCGTTPPRG